MERDNDLFFRAAAGPELKKGGAQREFSLPRGLVVILQDHGFIQDEALIVPLAGKEYLSIVYTFRPE